MNQLNAYHREKVAAAAAQTRRENEAARALYGARTRGATIREHQKRINNARVDGITPPGFFRRF